LPEIAELAAPSGKRFFFASPLSFVAFLNIRSSSSFEQFRSNYNLAVAIRAGSTTCPPGTTSRDAGCCRVGLDSRSARIRDASLGLVPVRGEGHQDRFLGDQAMAETLASKPGFRDDFQHRRCLVFANGFYEWLPTGAKKISGILFDLTRRSSVSIARSLVSRSHP
jgi:putative SOS response-associated peptidase YedK